MRVGADRDVSSIFSLLSLHSFCCVFFMPSKIGNRYRQRLAFMESNALYSGNNFPTVDRQKI